MMIQICLDRADESVSVLDFQFRFFRGITSPIASICIYQNTNECLFGIFLIHTNRSAAFTWCLALVLLLFVSSVYADRLPNETPENQIFSIDSLIDATGPIEQSMLQSWVLASPDSIPTGILGSRQSIADTMYKDHILTNGGRLSLNKNYQFDSKNRRTAFPISRQKKC